jgi:Fe-S cluster assembly protein SufD
MTQAPAKYERYQSQFDGIVDESSPKWLDSIRRQGMNDFSTLGFPTARRGNENWKYTNINRIANAEFDIAPNSNLTLDQLKESAPWDDDWTTLVFVNGRYSAELSSSSENGSVTVGSIAELSRNDGKGLEAHLSSLANIDQDGFTALNTAFVSDGAFVQVAEGASIETPLHLLFVSTESDTPFITHPRVLVVAGKDSDSTIIESYVSVGGGNYFSNAVAEIILEAGAQIDHYRLLNESDEAFHVGVVRVSQGDGSIFSSAAFYNNVRLGRHDLLITIGDGCETNLGGLYMTTGRQHVDNFINLDHIKPNSKSRLFYKGILADRSRAVFGGTVYVRKGAIKTDSMQSDKNLLLSPDAEIDSKPALFIWADDVKCGHGATAGNIEKDTLFYMRSRGIELEEASRLLIYGFAAEIIETVKVKALSDHLEKIFLDALPRYSFEF